MIIANLTQNAKTAQQVIADAVARCRSSGPASARQRLKYALITRPERPT